MAERTQPATDGQQQSSRGVPWSGLGRYPRMAVVGGALCLAMSGIFVRLADVTPSTAAVYRAVYALPFLAVVAWLEDRDLGPRTWSTRRWAFLAGLFFAADLTFFHHGIELMGAALATVFGNLQVIFVAAVAWLFLGERLKPNLLAGVPLALVGVVLISGVIGGDAYGSDPGLGVVVGLLTAASYAGYLLVLRRGQESFRVAGPIFDATLSCAIAAAVGGILVGDLQPIPTWPSAFWLFLLALSAQFGGGLLIAVALPRLPAVTTSLILLVQPLVSVGLAMVIVNERPSPWQLLGVVLVLIGVGVGTVPLAEMRRRRAQRREGRQAPV